MVNQILAFAPLLLLTFQGVFAPPAPVKEDTLPAQLSQQNLQNQNPYQVLQGQENTNLAPTVPYWSLSYIEPVDILSINIIRGPISTLRDQYFSGSNCYEISTNLLNPTEQNQNTGIVAFQVHQSSLINAPPDVLEENNPQITGAWFWDADCDEVLRQNPAAEIIYELNAANGHWIPAEQGFRWEPLAIPPTAKSVSLRWTHNFNHIQPPGQTSPDQMSPDSATGSLSTYLHSDSVNSNSPDMTDPHQPLSPIVNDNSPDLAPNDPSMGGDGL